MKAWLDFPLRVARGDFLRLVDRGRDYVVHAARVRRDGNMQTACGRYLRLPQEMDAPDTATSCKACLANLPR